MTDQAIIRVPQPDFTPNTVAKVVRGYSMGAIRDGWLVFYEQEFAPPHAGLRDKLCVVMTSDDRDLVRFVKKGRLPGRYDLLTVTGEPILDAELKWAAEVTLIKPYIPSDEEAAALWGEGKG
ncbi:hypothetical protein DEA98_14135 [Brucella pseudogrignonensis]|nr:hypothetical protein [Brucella pseudogrignonensis]